MNELISELELAELQRRVSQQSGPPPDKEQVRKVEELRAKILEMGHQVVVRHEIRLVGDSGMFCSAGERRHQWDIDRVGWVIQIGESNAFMLKTLKDVIDFMETWLGY